MLSRRQIIAGAAAFPVAIPAINMAAQSATPAASPIASPVASTAPATEDVLPAWLDAHDALRQLGEQLSEAFWSGDTDTLVSLSTPEVAAAFEGTAVPGDLTAPFVNNQIHFAFREVGAWFFGQYNAETISGTFSQAGPIPFEATPDEPQTGDVPAGMWTGTIGPGIVDLGIALEFSGDADALEVKLSIPSQLLISRPMTDVVVAPELLIGDRVDQRVLPAGGEIALTNLYGEQYEWGSNTLSLSTAWDGDGKLAGLQLIPQGTLPELEEREPIVARLPFEGAWMVFWGGVTEFQNYHAVVASQRYAADLAVWQDGATAAAPGTENEQYYAFGQPYLSPVDGTVVSAVDAMDDIPPQMPGSNPMDHPAGNHVVIESQGGYVYLAHCQSGSIIVQQGDTVSAGDVVAAVGNSGNTSEPHVHIHAQTHADMFDPQVAGIPLVFENALENGEPVEQLSILHGTIVEHRS